ncbi:MAG: hypothetical protein ACM3VZ_14010 [Acidobacteriota bacterium]
MSNATVTIKGANNVTVTATAGDDGHYSGANLTGLTAPYRVEACGVVDGAQTCYYSMVSGSGVANVTPLTHAALALAQHGDASSAFSSTPPAVDDVRTHMQALQTALAPVLTAAGLSSATDLATLSFNADRTGMDKVLDAVKVNAGVSGGHAFVQLEGRVSAGNFLIDDTGTSTTSSLTGGNMAVDMSGMSAPFEGMSTAIGQNSEAGCLGSAGWASIFDAQFIMNMEGSSVTAGTFPTMVCHMGAMGGLLGGRVAHPVVHDCDFSHADKICTVSFDVIHGDVVFDGAELAVVQRNGQTAWKLLGMPSQYEVHVNAAVQRKVRVDLTSPVAHYYRAISFDIASMANGDPHAIRAAKVYLHDSQGSGWEATPIATLSDASGMTDCSAEVRLTYAGSQCGSTWMGLDSNAGGGGLISGASMNGDAVIDAFFQRGRVVKIDLYSDTLATHLVDTVYKRVEGVPPKWADLDSVAWLEVDSATKTHLMSYDSSTVGSQSIQVNWAANKIVSPKDISMSGAGEPRAHDDFSLADVRSQSKTLDASAVTLTAGGFKLLSLFGRTRDGLGVETQYVSCSGAPGGMCPTD